MNLKNITLCLIIVTLICCCKNTAEEKENLPANLPNNVKNVSANKEKTGIFDFTFKSNIDNEEDSFSIYLPTNYNKSKKYKLIVGLHGYNVYNKQVMVTEPVKNYADENDTIILGPNGRGNYFYFGKAEADIISLINWTKLNYPIDENKVFLFGISMGGLGALDMGLHYPDLFSGIVCVHGDAGVKEYASISKEDMYYLNQIFTKRVFDAPVEILVQNMFSVWFYENGLNLPILFIHSKDDPMVPYADTYNMYEVMKKNNYNVEFVSYDNLNHNAAKIIRESQNSIYNFLNKYQKNTNPDTVYYKTTNNYYNKAYWITLNLVKNNEEGYVKITKRIENGKYFLSISEAKNLSSLTIDRSVINTNQIKIENNSDIEIKITLGENQSVINSKSSIEISF